MIASGPVMTVSKEEKQTLIKKFRASEGDTGSAKVQVALLSAKITKLTQHFDKHSKDHSSRRGLLKMVGQRRKLLGYLKNISNKEYLQLVEDLGLRK